MASIGEADCVDPVAAAAALSIDPSDGGVEDAGNHRPLRSDL
jgi:hypothetical protein